MNFGYDGDVINEYTSCSDDNLLIISFPNKRGTIVSADSVEG